MRWMRITCVLVRDFRSGKGKLFTWSINGAEKANFRALAGVSLEDMSPVTLDSLVTRSVSIDCKLMFTMGSYRL